MIWIWLGFIAFVLLMLVLDLGVFHRKAHVVSVREALKWTAVWVAGIFHLLPFIGGVIGLLAMIYAFYTFYLGAPVVKKCPAEKAAGYTIVVVICAVVLFVLIGGALTSALIGGGMMGMGMWR
jgi:hypothetical protein